VVFPTHFLEVPAIMRDFTEQATVNADKSAVCREKNVRQVVQKSAADLPFHGGRKLYRLRLVREKMSGAGDQNAEQKACMDKGSLHPLPALSAPLPEIRHSIRRRQNQAARAVPSSVNGYYEYQNGIDRPDEERLYRLEKFRNSKQ
jgi:hypothetical protein